MGTTWDRSMNNVYAHPTLMQHNNKSCLLKIYLTTGLEPKTTGRCIVRVRENLLRLTSVVKLVQKADRPVRCKRSDIRHKLATRHDFVLDFPGSTAMTTQTQDTVTVTFTVSREDAWEFAEFMKRLGWEDYRMHVTSRESAYQAQSVGEAIRMALRQQDINPR